MTAENFVYWLQGYVELANPESIGVEQLNTIKEHLALVLTKTTGTSPLYGNVNYLRPSGSC